MSLPSFNDPWYHQMIDEHLARHDGDENSRTIARGIMIAGGFIAQAIGLSFGLERDSTASILSSVADSADRLADALKSFHAESSGTVGLTDVLVQLEKDLRSHFNNVRPG